MYAWSLGIFESVRAILPLRWMKSRGAGTLIGVIAIVLWATWPALSVMTRAVPPFESMALIFLFAWAVTALVDAYLKAPELRSGFRHQWMPALVFAFGESGATIFFLMACRRIPAAEANLIIFLWPGLTIGFAALLGAYRLHVRHAVGIVLGFLGVAVLMGAELSVSWSGIGLAFLGGLAWTVYCVYRLVEKSKRGSPLSLGFAFCTVLCCALHLALETWVTPTAQASLAIALIAIVPTAIANVLWDQGLRRGDGRLLAVMAYGTPLASAVLLTGLGLQAYSWRLAVGAVTIVCAGILSRLESAAPIRD
jgi:drug/metabolite transporter (DMT)-like permease